jgi:hypothetical protein
MTFGRRILGPLAAVLLAVGLFAAIYVSVRNAASQRAIVAVHGVVGSEKGAFFGDPDVLTELRKNGLDVSVTTEGSREMALSGSKDGADFYFPAGEPAGRELTKRLNLHTQSTPFYTPMVVASWMPIATVLQRNGMVQRSGGYYMLDMPKLLDAVARNERWSDLRDNSAYATNKSLLIASTDVRKSNSAAMYLALASYVYNGGNVVTSVRQASAIAPKVRGLFLRQGFQENSSAGPFDDYVTIGMGKAPLVMSYEQQFIEYLVAHPPDQRPQGMVLLYPRPTIFTKHTLVPTDDKGQRLAQLLESDQRLRELEIRHGFRNSDTAAMQTIWKGANVSVPPTLIDVVDPPSFEVLETMIDDIDKAYASQ